MCVYVCGYAYGCVNGVAEVLGGRGSIVGVVVLYLPLSFMHRLPFFLVKY